MQLISPGNNNAYEQTTLFAKDKYLVYFSKSAGGLSLQTMDGKHTIVSYCHHCISNQSLFIELQSSDITVDWKLSNFEFWKTGMALWPLVNTFIYLRNYFVMAVETDLLVGQRRK